MFNPIRQLPVLKGPLFHETLRTRFSHSDLAELFAVMMFTFKLNY
jgi:hypothetical protein